MTASEHPGDVRDTISAGLDHQAARADLTAIERDTAAFTRDDVAMAVADGTDASACAARYWALRDRFGAASDRLLAANLRNHAQTDRFYSATDRHDSSTDHLTGSYRRDFGLIEIARTVGAARRAKQSAIIGFLDIDGLKLVNDTHGHAAGDIVLQSVSTALRATLRDYDPIIRYGGDEFVFCMANVTEEEGIKRIETLNDTLDAAGTNTVSYGLTTISPTETVLSALQRADQLLYRQRTRTNP